MSSRPQPQLKGGANNIRLQSDGSATSGPGHILFTAPS